MELTASTALQLWYELMQRAILNGDTLDSLDTLGFNFLHYASLEGNLEVVRMLLDRGVPVNIVSENHQRIVPIHWACLRAHMDVVLLLLERGADINAGDSEGHTPLQKAAQYGQTKLCQTLVARGCAVDQTDRHGHTALHWAAYMGKLLTVEFLLGRGADVNFRDGERKTPLHRALQQSQEERAALPHIMALPHARSCRRCGRARRTRLRPLSAGFRRGIHQAISSLSAPDSPPPPPLPAESLSIQPAPPGIPPSLHTSHQARTKSSGKIIGRI